MTQLEESAHFSLLHDAATACLYASWQGVHDEATTKRGYELVLHYARATRSTRLLNDSLLDKDGWQNLTDWLAGSCFQDLAQAGIQAIAWVLPRHAMALYDTASVLIRIERPMVDVFLDAEAAYAWLQRWPTT